MTNHTNNSISWDCPITHDDLIYATFYHIDDDRVRKAAVKVSDACNWFTEQDQALVTLCINEDEYSIRQWGEAVTDRLPEIVRDGGEDPDDSDCIEWMDDVRRAWAELFETFN